MTFNEKLMPPKGKVDVILDTDAYNEVDDQYAITYLLRNNDRLNTLGFCAAPFFNHRSSSPADGMKKSYDEILKLLSILKITDMPVYSGSENYLPDENTPVNSPAAEFIIASAKKHTPDNPLYVVAIGAITNVASALLICPEIKNNIVVVWLGGHERSIDSTEEFNMMQDIPAARAVMQSGVPFVQLPCVGVVDDFNITISELNKELLNTTAIANYLVESTVNYCKPRGDQAKVIWDVTAIAWLLNECNDYVSFDIVDTLLPDYNGHMEKTAIPNKMGYVTKIHSDKLKKDLFVKLVK